MPQSLCFAPLCPMSCWCAGSCWENNCNRDSTTGGHSISTLHALASNSDSGSSMWLYRARQRLHRSVSRQWTNRMVVPFPHGTFANCVGLLCLAADVRPYAMGAETRVIYMLRHVTRLGRVGRGAE